MHAAIGGGVPVGRAMPWCAAPGDGAHRGARVVHCRCEAQHTARADKGQDLAHAQQVTTQRRPWAPPAAAGAAHATPIAAILVHCRPGSAVLRGVRRQGGPWTPIVPKWQRPTSPMLRRQAAGSLALGVRSLSTAGGSQLACLDDARRSVWASRVWGRGCLAFAPAPQAAGRVAQSSMMIGSAAGPRGTSGQQRRHRRRTTRHHTCIRRAACASSPAVCCGSRGGACWSTCRRSFPMMPTSWRRRARRRCTLAC